MTTQRPRRVLAHCNAGHEYGLGHLMRSVGVLEEAVGRGWQARIVGDLDPAATSRLAQLLPGVPVEAVAPSGLPGVLDGQVADWQPDVLHLDSYWLEAAAVPAGQHLVSNVQDAPFGVRPADLVIDPNLGAEVRIAAPGPGPHLLVGQEAAIIRRQVRQRATAPRELDRVRRVLVVLGGSDPFALTPRVTAALSGLPDAPRLTVVTPPAQRADLAALAAATPHRIDLVEPVDDLPGLAAGHDLVVSAAGTSVWDIAHLGVPLAILAVTENQRAGYLAATTAGIAHGLGLPPHEDLAARVAGLGELFGQPGELTAAAIRGRTLIDGLGTWRIVSAWEQLLARTPGREPSGASPTARPATPADAGVLLCWRNDPVTRAASRTSDEIPLAAHLAWLKRVLADPDRQLLVLEDGDGPVASVRWDRLGGRAWEVSITLAPRARGRGLAPTVLSVAEEALVADRPLQLRASVHRDNRPSLGLFARCGYLPYAPADADGFLSFARWLL